MRDTVHRYNADMWRTHRMTDLARLRTRLLDELQPGPTTWTTRHPTKHETTTTDRKDGNFHPTPHQPSARAAGTHSDPTARQALTQEQRAQTAVTTIWQTVEQLATDPSIDTPPPPKGIALRVTLTGHHIPDIHPDACRALVRRCCHWLTQVVDLHADRLSAARHDLEYDTLQQRSREIEHAIHHATPRLPKDPPADTIIVCHDCTYRPRKYRHLGLCNACNMARLRATA